MTDFAIKSKPIGVYDSGVGGLSVLKALRDRLPGEAFIYVADSANAPYGNRTPEFVEARARRVAAFLVQRQAKALVLACNTASVVAARRLRRLHSLPIVAMEPAIKPAVLATRTNVVLVLATTNTLQSQSVEQLCQTYGSDVRIILQACPGLADQVESRQFNSHATRKLLENYIRPGLAAGADTIVLGCTHYAFLANEIAAIAGPSVSVIEPSKAIANQLARVLSAAPSLSCCQGMPAEFFTSGAPRALSTFLQAIGEPFERVQALPAGALCVQPMGRAAAPLIPPAGSL